MTEPEHESPAADGVEVGVIPGPARPRASGWGSGGGSTGGSDEDERAAGVTPVADPGAP